MPTDSDPTTRTGESPHNSLKKLFEETSPIKQSGRSHHKGFESLFQDFSDGLQRRTEAWGVARAVRGAVTEARRNMLQPEPWNPDSRPWYYNAPRFGPMKSGPTKPTSPVSPTTNIKVLQERNKILAAMLTTALQDLQLVKESAIGFHSAVDDALNRAVSRISTVQSDLGGVQPSGLVSDAPSSLDGEIENEPSGIEKPSRQDKMEPLMGTAVPSNPVPTLTERPTEGQPTLLSTPITDKTEIDAPETSQSATIRPSLSQSEFSWMLGDITQRSSFVTSTSLPPDQSRQCEYKSKANPLFGDGRNHSRGRTSLVIDGSNDDDGMVLSSLPGERDSSCSTQV